jgi:hypothetical protein
VDEEEEETLPALALSSSIQNGYRMSTVWPHRYDGHDVDDDVVEFGIRSVAAEAAARLEKKSSTNRCRGDRTR